LVNCRVQSSSNWSQVRRKHTLSPSTVVPGAVDDAADDVDDDRFFLCLVGRGGDVGVGEETGEEGVSCC
jgi:hypothetical protein